jgi:hypothetical protein
MLQCADLTGGQFEFEACYSFVLVGGADATSCAAGCALHACKKIRSARHYCLRTE